jgi:tyrosinase
MARDLAATQSWADGFLDERAVPPAALTLEGIATTGPGTGFSPFIPEDARRARDLSREIMRAADAAGGGDAGLAAAQARTEQLLLDEDRALVRFALKLFMTHHADGRRLQIAALERRAPLKVVPSGPPPPLSDVGLEATGSQEAILNWWREDPELNEHHDHWHAVYPTSGIADPRPGDPEHTRLQDRQGELFFYMHEQMLARYDHERLAVGLPPVAPLDAYAAKIPEGYDPSAGLRGFPADLWTDGEQPRPRPDDATMAPSFPTRGGPLPRTRLDAWHAALKAAAEQGELRSVAGTPFATTVDALGHATEPSSDGDPVDPAAAPDGRLYGALHGMGHMFLAIAAGEPFGVMADTDTAIRDPVFYRWHRHVDDLAFTWQETQEAHDLATHAAPVTLRHGDRPAADRPAESPDLILLREQDVGADLDDEAFAAAVQAAVGGSDHWDEDFAAALPGTSELQTEMLWRPLRIEPPIPGAPPVRIPYLDQQPFAYAVRLGNPVGAEQDVTIRLLLVADALFDDRRTWIELDKFRFHVSGPQAVAVRRARDSSVIRKPASKPPGPTRHSPQHLQGEPPPGWDEESFCDCGWPYNLLIPRGTGAGMRCWLAAVVTDWELDQVTSSACGSMSYCGAKDRYPDQRPMGYPLDRPLSGPEIADALSRLDSAAARSFTIRWLNPAFPD